LIEIIKNKEAYLTKLKNFFSDTLSIERKDINLGFNEY